MTTTFVVLAHGGRDLGVGHLSRASTIAASLARSAPTKVVFEAPSDLVPSHLDVPFTLSTDRESSRRLLADSGNRESVLVTDMLGLDQDDHLWARSAGFSSLVHLNDSGIDAYRPDVIVNTDVLPAQLVVPPSTSVISGARFHPIRADVAARRPTTMPPVCRLNAVVVWFGGADPGRCTEAILADLSSPPPFELTIVLGDAFTPSRCRELRALADPHVAVAHASEIPRLLEAADLAVTSGGLTTYEAMTVGTPVAALPWAHLRPVVARLIEAGVVTALSPERPLRSIIDLTLSPSALKANATKAWRLVDGQGAHRAAAAIIAATSPQSTGAS